MFVPVDARAKRRFRIVHMNHGDAIEPNGRSMSTSVFSRPASCGYPSPRQKDAPYRCKRPAADPASVDDRSQLLEFRSNRGALPRRVFEQDCRSPSFNPRAACLSPCAIAAIAWSIGRSRSARSSPDGPPGNRRPAPSRARIPDETPAPTGRAAPDWRTQD